MKVFLGFLLLIIISETLLIFDVKTVSNKNSDRFDELNERYYDLLKSRNSMIRKSTLLD